MKFILLFLLTFSVYPFSCDTEEYHIKLAGEVLKKKQTFLIFTDLTSFSSKDQENVITPNSVFELWKLNIESSISQGSFLRKYLYNERYSRSDLEQLMNNDVEIEVTVKAQKKTPVRYLGKDELVIPGCKISSIECGYGHLSCPLLNEKLRVISIEGDKDIRFY